MSGEGPPTSAAPVRALAYCSSSGGTAAPLHMNRPTQAARFSGLYPTPCALHSTWPCCRRHHGVPLLAPWHRPGQHCHQQHRLGPQPDPGKAGAGDVRHGVSAELLALHRWHQTKLLAWCLCWAAGSLSLQAAAPGLPRCRWQAALAGPALRRLAALLPTTCGCCSAPSGCPPAHHAAGPALQIFLPRQGHPAYGVVRAVVEDFDDSTTETFLDSGGGRAAVWGRRRRRCWCAGWPVSASSHALNLHPGIMAV